MSFQATTKQRSYFHSLTGEWPRSGASKSEVSRLIQKALKGEITKKQDVVNVYGWRFAGPQAECLIEALRGKVYYSVDVNYRMAMNSPKFETLEAAEIWARKFHSDAQINVSSSVREQYMD